VIREWEQAFLEALRLGRTEQDAADWADVSLKTVKRHKKADAELRSRIRAAKQAWRAADAQRRLDHVQAMLR
jgi:hypothetical protein